MTDLAKHSASNDSITSEYRLSSLLRSMVERSYLAYLDQLPWRIQQEDWEDPFSTIGLARFLEVSDTLEDPALRSMLAGLNASKASLRMVIAGKEDGSSSIYLGSKVLPKARASRMDAFNILQHSVHNNLPGAVLDEPMTQNVFRSSILKPLDEYSHLACITGIPTSEFETGWETLMDGLRYESYMVIVMADPIPLSQIEELLDRLRLLGTDVHTLVRQSLEQSHQRTTGDSFQTTGSLDGIPLLISALFSGFTPLRFLGSKGTSNTYSTSETISKSMGAERLDKELAYVEMVLDDLAKRAQQGRHSGLWNVGLFLLTRERQSMALGQSLLRGILSGEEPQGEPLRTLWLSKRLDQMRSTLAQFKIPRIGWADDGEHPLGRCLDQLSTPLTSRELGQIIRPPQTEVPGLRRVPLARFNVNPPQIDSGIRLGQIIHVGQVLSKHVMLDSRALTRHAFVTGVTGAGKTNSCLLLLKSAVESGTPFLVIEPAKQEYRQLCNHTDSCQVFTLGDESEYPIRLNPFQFLPGFPLLTHIDFLKAIFNASFPMYASMPFILEEALIRVYEDWGWDITTSQNKFAEGKAAFQFLPTIHDLFERIDSIVAEKRYAERLTLDITAALKARIRSLLVGSKGKMFSARYSPALQTLFDTPTVLELRRIGSDDEKCFLIALFLVWLYENCELREQRDGLQHLTLLEEAHRILKNVPSISNESIGTRGQAVETFSNMLAEIRAYGEGLIIVDQIPGKLTPDVVKNTDLKLLHRLVAADDREFVGQTMGMSPEQIEHAARLKVGEAIVYYEAAHMPILTKIDRASWKSISVADAGPNASKVSVSCELDPAFCCFCEDHTVGSLSRELNSELVQSGYTALAASMMLPAEISLRYWRNFVILAYRQIRSQVSAPDNLLQRVYCTMAHILELLTSELIHYHQPSNSDQMLVLARVETAQIINALLHKESTVAQHIADLAGSMKRGVALHPSENKAGCSLCTRQCELGFWVNVAHHQQLEVVNKRLATKLGTASRTEVPGIARTVVREVYPELDKIEDELIHCVLSSLGLSVRNLEALDFYRSDK